MNRYRETRSLTKLHVTGVIAVGFSQRIVCYGRHDMAVKARNDSGHSYLLTIACDTEKIKSAVRATYELHIYMYMYAHDAYNSQVYVPFGRTGPTCSLATLYWSQ